MNRGAARREIGVAPAGITCAEETAPATIMQQHLGVPDLCKGDPEACRFRIEIAVLEILRIQLGNQLRSHLLFCHMVENLLLYRTP
jgi:hypothetical protein